jgi:hypothetical protein
MNLETSTNVSNKYYSNRTAHRTTAQDKRKFRTTNNVKSSYPAPKGNLEDSYVP